MSFGVWCKTPHPSHIDVLASSGVDYIIVDLQHGAVGADDVLPITQAAKAWDCSTFVRLAVNDHVSLQRVIDVGVAGVVVPGVTDVDGARAVAKYFDYPPTGERSRGTIRASFDAGRERVAERPLYLPLIETTDSVDHIDAILDTPGVDGAYIGPVDLGTSLGVGPRNFESPALLGAFERVEAACRARSLTVGSGADTTDEALMWVQRGHSYVTLGTDWGILRRSLAQRVSDVTKALGHGSSTAQEFRQVR